MNNESRLGVAVIGCGYWGGNYVRVFNELPDCRTVAVSDLCPGRLSDIHARFRNVVVSTDARSVLTRKDVDAVVVCTPATMHYDIAMDCLIHGKHVLIEKPITTTVTDAMELVNCAEALGRTLMVGHTFIYNAGVSKLKECATYGGPIYYMHSRRTNLGPVRHDVNAIWDLASHDIAIFNHLLDSTPAWVSAVGASVLGNGREDVGFISVGYPGGVVGNIHVSWADPNKAREVVVVCSDKRVVFNDLSFTEQIRVFHKGLSPVRPEPTGFGEHIFQVHDGDIVSPRVESTEPLKAQCRHFVECVRSGHIPTTSGLRGAEVVEVLNAADRSIAKGGAQVEVQNIGNYSRKRTAAAIC